MAKETPSKPYLCNNCNSLILRFYMFGPAMPHGPRKINKVKVKSPSSQLGKKEDHERGLIQKLKLKQVTFVSSMYLTL